MQTHLDRGSAGCDTCKQMKTETKEAEAGKVRVAGTGAEACLPPAPSLPRAFLRELCTWVCRGSFHYDV